MSGRMVGRRDVWSVILLASHPQPTGSTVPASSRLTLSFAFLFVPFFLISNSSSGHSTLSWAMISRIRGRALQVIPMSLRLVLVNSMNSCPGACPEDREPLRGQYPAGSQRPELRPRRPSHLRSAEADSTEPCREYSLRDYVAELRVDYSPTWSSTPSGNSPVL